MPSNVSKLAATYSDNDAQDAIDALLTAGSNISYTYDDQTDDLTITSTDTNLTQSEVADIIGAVIESDSGTSVTYDSENSKLTVSLSNSISPNTVNSNTISNNNYNESTKTHSSASGTVTIDLQTANVHQVEAVDDITFAFANVSTTPDGNSVTIYVIDSDGAGPYTLSWPASVVWNGGSAVSEVSQNTNIEISLLTADGGTEWRGRKSGGEFA